LADAVGDPHARSASLDTVRGIAILLVLIGHYLHAAPFAVAGIPAGTLVQDFGHGGVLLFFLLSGYLIWTTAQRVGGAAFLLRRFAKIAPAYWINVLFVAVMGASFALYPAFDINTVLGNLLFLEGSLGIAPMSGVYWTLIVEVKFYILFALVFFTPARPLFWLVPFGAVAINLGAVAMLGRGSTFLTYLPAFFIGAGVAAAERGRLPLPVVAAIAIATIAGLGFGAAHRGWPAATFLVIDIALFVWAKRSGFTVAWLAALGIISYSVYLYHMTLGQPLLEGLGPNAGWLWPLLLAAVTLATLAISWLSWRFVETGGVALGRWIERSLSADAKIDRVAR
jgi:peptidoglycan/LPS O-acetylase OafA/YrhL